ncbi:hypothetical protein NE607_14660, partial [Dorea longicatena]|uniref:hypothetical protein n=1 Tax=Dorea longicatena TaxID=88431 RepID=UPI00210B80C9
KYSVEFFRIFIKRLKSLQEVKETNKENMKKKGKRIMSRGKKLKRKVTSHAMTTAMAVSMLGV